MALFQKGQSGNPGGRPAGARTAVAGLRRDMITDDDVAAIVEIVVAKARDGDLAAAGMILDRCIPKLRITADVSPDFNHAEVMARLRAARARVVAHYGPAFETRMDAELAVVSEVADGAEPADALARNGFSAQYARAREAEAEISGQNRPEPEPACVVRPIRRVAPPKPPAPPEPPPTRPAPSYEERPAERTARGSSHNARA